MASIKLNKRMRDAIVDDLTSNLQKEVDVINRESAALAKMLYDEIFSADQQKLMKSLPEGWLTTFDSFFVLSTVEDRRRVVLKLPFRERRPYNMDTYRGEGTFKKYPRFGKAFRDWERRYEEARKRLTDAKRKATAVVNSTTTVARLLKVWPEAEAAIKRNVGAANSVGTTLALPIAELNSVLELPEKVAA